MATILPLQKKRCTKNENINNVGPPFGRFRKIFLGPFII
jgi:hypothetical protein